MSEEQILVVAAHPDDEVLGCGGMVARFSATVPVHLKIMGQGIAARGGDPARIAQEVQRLQACAEQAAKRLGYASTEWGSAAFADNAFDTGPLLALVRTVEETLIRVQPTVIYTHHGGDLNIDHRLTFQAVLTACRPQIACSVRTIYSFEVPSATDWAFQQFAPWNPTRFVGIEGSLERKLEALACYASEARDFPHPRSPEAIRARAVWWGGVTGLGAAEAFTVVRELV